MPSSVPYKKLQDDIQQTNFDPSFTERYWRTEAVFQVDNELLKKNFETYKNEQLKHVCRKILELLYMF